MEELKKKLQEQITALENELRIELPREIAKARAHGDLSENAEYHAAREKQGHIQAKIDLLRDQLARAYIIDKSTLPTDAVVFGARVKVKDLDLAEEEEFVLVGPGDEDYNSNRILTSSPIGQGLLGKKIGDVVEITVPMGKLRFEVMAISFDG